MSNPNFKSKKNGSSETYRHIYDHADRSFRESDLCAVCGDPISPGQIVCCGACGDRVAESMFDPADFQTAVMFDEHDDGGSDE